LGARLLARAVFRQFRDRYAGTRVLEILCGVPVFLSFSVGEVRTMLEEDKKKRAWLIRRSLCLLVLSCIGRAPSQSKMTHAIPHAR
jgi:hypothetical protein